MALLYCECGRLPGDNPCCPKCNAHNDHLAALHSAEREVLEACVEEDRLWVEYEAGWNSVGKYDSARDARIAAVRRYRALLDGKEAK